MVNHHNHLSCQGKTWKKWERNTRLFKTLLKICEKYLRLHTVSSHSVVLQLIISLFDIEKWQVFGDFRTDCWLYPLSILRLCENKRPASWVFFCLLHAWLIFSPNMTIQYTSSKCNFARCFAFREDVATGEVWFGADALAKGLVDELQTSSEYIMQQIRNGHEVLEVTYKKSAGGGLAGAFGALEGQQLERLEALTALKSLVLGFNGFNGNRTVSVTDLVKASGLASALESESWPKGLAQPRVEARWNEPQARLTRDLPEVWLAVPSQDLRDYLDEYKQIWDLVWPSDIMQWHQSTRCGCHQSSSLIRWFNDTINFPS